MLPAPGFLVPWELCAIRLTGLLTDSLPAASSMAAEPAQPTYFFSYKTLPLKTFSTDAGPQCILLLHPYSAASWRQKKNH
jgi:hypothetical protein